MTGTTTADVKPKRGRRTKKEIEAAKLELLQQQHDSQKDLPPLSTPQNVQLKIDPTEEDTHACANENAIDNDKQDDQDSDNVKSVSKKRGRKPKGGKIIQQTIPVPWTKEPRPNIILHLKCSVKDVESTGDHNSNFTTTSVDPYNFEAKNEYEILDTYSGTLEKTSSGPTEDDATSAETREVWRKLKVLEKDLHMNNTADKKSACFWCSFDFDNPPIHIPKHFVKNSYHVYGCFCTPECAVAHLMQENIDSSAKFERYQLMNSIYSKVYDYKKNIKPAPDPHYMLDKFYGNLKIQEYRLLLRSERLFLIVDKPLTRILPEFHEDNDDFIINNKIIPSNNYQVKKRPQKKFKTAIMNEKFGLPVSATAGAT